MLSMKLATLLLAMMALGFGLAQSAIRAPDFKLYNTNGKIVQLSSYKGQAVVLVFWATWCDICAEEMPKLNALYKRNPGKFAVVPVHMDPGVPSNQIISWVKDHGWAFPAMLDAPSGGEQVDSVRNVVRNYRVLGTPTFFFIDKTGVLKAYNPGGISESDFRKALALLGVDI